MSHVHYEHHVEAPAERLFALAEDAVAIPNWDTVMVRVWDATGPLDEVGRTFHTELRLGGIRTDATAEVIDVHRPLRLRCRLRSARGDLIDIDRRIEPGVNGCRMQVDIEYRPGNLLSRLLDGVVLSHLLAREVRRSEDAFCDLASGPDAP